MSVLREIKTKRVLLAIKEGDYRAIKILEEMFEGLVYTVYAKYRGFFSSENEIRNDMETILWETAYFWNQKKNLSAIKYLMSMYMNNFYKYARLFRPFLNIARENVIYVPASDDSFDVEESSVISDVGFFLRDLLVSEFGERKTALFLDWVEGKVDMEEVAFNLGLSKYLVKKEFDKMKSFLKRRIKDGNICF